MNNEEFPFEIPESWVWVRLGEIFHLQAGKYISAKEINPNMQDDLYTCYGGNGIRGYVRSYNQEGSFPIIGRQGALCGNIHLATGKFYATEHAVVVNQFGHVNVQWAVYFLTQLNLNQYSTATAQPGLAVNKINNVHIPLPPISEQKRIVAKIEELLPFIEQYAKKEQELTALHLAFPEQLKKSILQAAIQGKLTEQNPNDEPAIELVKRIQTEKERLILEKKIKKPKQNSEIVIRDNLPYEMVNGVERCIADEIPFEIPESWVWVRLGEICIFNIQSSINGVDIPINSWVLDLEDIEKQSGTLLQKKFKISNNVKSQKNLFCKNDVLYGKLRPYLNKVIVADEDGFCSTEIVPLRFSTFILNKYAKSLLMSQYFLTFSKNNSHGTKMPRFNLEKGKDFLFPLPPLSEQKRIVTKIEQIFLSLDDL